MLFLPGSEHNNIQMPKVPGGLDAEKLLSLGITHFATVYYDKFAFAHAHVINDRLLAGSVYRSSTF